MTSSVRAGVIPLLVEFLLLLGCQGWADTPAPVASRSNSLSAEAGKIGAVVIVPKDPQTLEIVRRGRASNFGRGATTGVEAGTTMGILCGPAAIVCVPGLGVVGWIVGGVYGIFSTESEYSAWQNSRHEFESVLTDMHLEEILLQHLLTYARDHGHALVQLPTTTQRYEQGPSSALSSPSDTIETILEIRDLHVLAGLDASSHRLTFNREMRLSVQIRLIRNADGAVLDDRIIAIEGYGAYNFAGWTAKKAKRFRDDVTYNVTRLAERIIDQELIHPR